MMTTASHARMTATWAILGVRATAGKIEVPAATAARLGKTHEATKFLRAIGRFPSEPCLSLYLFLSRTAEASWAENLQSRHQSHVGV